MIKTNNRFLVIILTIFFVTFLNAKPQLSDFSRNDFSQFGEDGIIEKIFEVIGTTSKIAVEFGAHDGLFCSNTARLWKNCGWKAILIEGDKTRYNSLVKNTKSFNCLPICEYIGIEEHNNLEAVLKKYDVPDEIDLLSIDVDGNDYYIFESLENLRPRVVIIEHNPTLPATLDIFQPYDVKSQCNGFGCSVEALNRLSELKGYKLICITTTNSIFVLESLYEHFESFETSLEKMQIDDYIKYIITDYKGRYLLVGLQKKFPYGINQSASNTSAKGPIHLFNFKLSKKEI